MRRKYCPWTVFLSAICLQACLSPAHIERGTTFDQVVQNDSETSLQFCDPETLNALKRRSEAGGAEPAEQSTISILDRLNQNASYRIGRSKDEREIELAGIVADLLEDPSEEVRFRAAELLGKIGGVAQEEILIASSEKDPSPVVREMAAESLEHLGLGSEVWTE